MKNIPYCLLPPPLVQGVAATFSGIGGRLSKNFPDFDEQLEHAGMQYTARDYLAVCFASDVLLFILFGFIIGLPLALPLGFLLSFFLTLFAAMQQITFPRVVTLRRVGRIEKNLLPALQDMRVQINAGIPMYSVLSNIAHADYGDVSLEFGKAVDRIGAGEEQLHVMQSVADANPSVFFRRAIMQISNGMQAGSDINSIISEIIDTLGDEQVIQLQRYGSQLNPISMMYMLLGIIAPSLAVTFIVLFTSFIKVSEYTVIVIFVGLYFLFIFFQVLFLGIIKSKRPNLI